MKVLSIINTLLIISASFIALLSLKACADDDYITSVDSETIDCQYCYEDMPELVDLKLVFNMKKYKEKVEFIVFSGYAFTSAVWMEGNTDVNELWIQVKPNQKYTVVAEYFDGDKTIYVINDALVKTKFLKTGCDKPCHYVYEVSCDLKLGEHKYK